MKTRVPDPPPAEPTASAPPSMGREAHAVEAWLAARVAARPLPENLRAAVEYALGGSGKRVRPVLALRSCAAVGADPTAALPAAAAIELVHNFSLVHDDLPAMDDDDLRRGRPTLHRHAGEAMGILGGDLMLGLAFEVLTTQVASGELCGRLCRELALAADDMIAGQVLDTVPASAPGQEPLERLRRIHHHKTGALIRCACRMGALCGSASAARLEALSRYGEAVGLMFQMVDDILDVTQTTEHLGKRAHKDADQGKLTFPGVLGLEASRREVARQRAAALAELEALGPAAEPLRELCEWLAVRTR